MSLLYPDKVLLPANAKGVIVRAAYEKVPQPQDFVVRQKGVERPLKVTVERLEIAPNPLLAEHFGKHANLWRIGVHGGFTPGASYWVYFGPNVNAGLTAPGDGQFQISRQTWDSATIRPILIAHGPPVSERRSFSAQGICSEKTWGLRQEFRTTVTGISAGLAAGLTYLPERSVDGETFKKVRFYADMCGTNTATNKLADAWATQIIRKGCTPPQRLQVRAWLGMLEVDERFVASDPITADWSDAPFAMCSAGKLLDKLKPH